MEKHSPQSDALQVLKTFEERLKITEAEFVQGAAFFLNQKILKLLENQDVPELKNLSSSLTHVLSDDFRSGEALKEVVLHLIHGTQEQIQQSLELSKERLSHGETKGRLFQALQDYAVVQSQNLSFQQEVDRLRALLELVSQENTHFQIEVMQLKIQLESSVQREQVLQDELESLKSQLAQKIQARQKDWVKMHELKQRIDQLEKDRQSWFSGLKRRVGAMCLGLFAALPVAAAPELVSPTSLAYAAPSSTALPSMGRNIDIFALTNEKIIQAAQKSPHTFFADGKIQGLKRMMQNDREFLKYDRGEYRIWGKKIALYFGLQSPSDFQVKMFVRVFQLYIGMPNLRADGRFGEESEKVFFSFLEQKKITGLGDSFRSSDLNKDSQAKNIPENWSAIVSEAKIQAEKLSQQAPRLANGQLADLSYFSDIMIVPRDTPYFHTDALKNILTLAIAFKKIENRRMRFVSLFRTLEKDLKTPAAFGVKAEDGDGLHPLGFAGDVSKYTASNPSFVALLRVCGFIRPVVDDPIHMVFKNANDRFPSGKGVRRPEALKINLALLQEQRKQQVTRVASHPAEQKKS